MPDFNFHTPSPLDDLYKPYRPPSLLSQQPDLAPQEQDSLLSRVASVPLTALQWVGNLLDKSFGGRAIRGVLGGHPEELASILPMSDTLGLTDIKNRVSGEDLLKNAGVDTGTDWGNTALGIGAEIGLDPATYLSLGGAALSKAGLAAKKAGTLASTWGGRIRAGQQGLAGFGVPPLLGLLGMDVTPSVLAGTGETAAKVADMLGGVGNKLLYSRPGTYLSEKFDSRIPSGVRDPFVQRDLRGAHAAELSETLPAGREAVAKLIQDTPPDVLHNPDLLRSSLENPPPSGLAESLPIPSGPGEARFYHGSPAPNLTEINPAIRSDFGLGGIDVTHNLGQAEWYSRGRRGAGGYILGDRPDLPPLGSIYEVRPNLRNPLVITEANYEALLGAHGDTDKGIAQWAKANGYDAIVNVPKNESFIFSDVPLPAQIAQGHPAAQVAQQYRDLDNRYLDRLLESGAAISPMEDPYAAHLYRSATVPNRTPTGFVGQEQGATFAGTTKRKNWTTGIPGGTETLNDISRDRNVSGLDRILNPQEARVAIMQDYLAPKAGLSFDPSQFAQFQKLQRSGPLVTAPDILDELAQTGPLWKKAGQVAKRVGELPAQTVESGMYANHPYADTLKYFPAADRAIANANQSMRLLTSEDVLQAGRQALAQGQPTVPLSKVLKPAGLSTGASAEDAARHTAAESIVMDMIDANRLPEGATLKDLKNIPIPKSVADSLAKAQRVFGAPDEGLRVFDSLTGLNKAMSTGPWPQFNVRNLVGDTTNSLSKGASIPGLLDAKGLRDALGTGETIPGLAAKFPILGATDEEVTKALARKYFAHVAGHSNIGQQFSGLSDTAGLGVPSVVGQYKEPTFWEAIQSYFKGRTNPFGEPIDTVAERANPTNISGFGGFGPVDKRNITQFAPSVAGQKLGYLEDKNTRGLSFLSKILEGYSPKAAGEFATAANFDYGAMTKFERDVMRRIFPFYCVPDDAEILTRDGWKKCDDLIVGEEVMTYSQPKSCLEWQPCQSKEIFDHDQSLMHYETPRGKAFSFTPEHRWPVQRNFVRVKRLKGDLIYPAEERIVEGKDLKTTMSFIQAAPFLGTESILTVDQARLLGWAMTDGYFRWRGTHCELLLYQHPKKFLVEVENVAGRKARWFHPDNGTATVPVIREKVQEIEPYLDKDNLIRVITRLSRPAAEAMYDAMYKADGTVALGRRADHFAKEHLGIRAAFRVLALMLGKSTTEGKRGCYITPRRTIKVASGKITWRHYKGRVWCPRTENGTWVMKQGTTIVITGNSYTKNIIPSAIGDVARQPGGLYGSMLKAGADVRDESMLPSKFGSGLALPIGDESGGMRNYLTSLGLPFEDVLRMLPAGPKPIQKTLEELLSNLNPMLKAPLEYASGKQFYGGRELSDRGARTGSAALDELIGATPASRIVSTGSSLASGDDATSKLLNLLSGARVQNIDVNKERKFATRDLIQQLMDSDASFKKSTDYFVKREDQGNLTPDQLALLKLAQQLKK